MPYIVKGAGRRGMGATAQEYADFSTHPRRALSGYVGARGTQTKMKPHYPRTAGGIPVPTRFRQYATLGSLGDADPTDPIVDAANAPTITVSADPQTAYTACLKGGGSFASCNQIPGVTPEMIVAAKASSIVSGPASVIASITSDPTKLALVGAAAVGLYLFARKKRGK